MLTLHISIYITQTDLDEDQKGTGRGGQEKNSSTTPQKNCKAPMTHSPPRREDNIIEIEREFEPAHDPLLSAGSGSSALIDFSQLILSSGRMLKYWCCPITRQLCGPKCRSFKKPIQNPKYWKQTPRLHEFFRKVRANFCLLPCDASQEPIGNCSEKLLQMNFFTLGGFCKGQKMHISFFNINFLAPTQNPPCWAPRKNYVPHFLGKNAKKGPTLFRGIFGVKMGSQTGHFRP